MCSILDVSRSGYYDWIDRPASARSIENKRLITKIKCFHRISNKIYGSPRIHRDLLDSGESISVKRVARLMKLESIQSKMAKRFVITTDSKNTMKAPPDQLKRNFDVTTANQAWVSDTTFIATSQGWLYLAVILDLYSRKIIGWSMSDRNNTQLVEDALVMALWRKGEAKNIILHSDQGSTYASTRYQQMMKENKLICSMSRKGKCLDNAVAESFFGSLKTEWTDDQRFKTRAEAKQSVFEYIEIFYNRKRRHSYLDYLSPEEFERRSVS